jgi:hypothetical protein
MVAPVVMFPPSLTNTSIVHKTATKGETKKSHYVKGAVDNTIPLTG